MFSDKTQGEHAYTQELNLQPSCCLVTAQKSRSFTLFPGFSLSLKTCDIFPLVELGTANCRPPGPLSPWQRAHLELVARRRWEAGEGLKVLDTDRATCDLRGSPMSLAAASDLVTITQRYHCQNSCTSKRNTSADKTFRPL